MAKVVVIGRNYTSRLGMVRAIGKAGHEVMVIRTNRGNDKDIDAFSKYVKGYFHAYEPDRNALMKQLLSLSESPDEKVVLIPVDDYAASVIDENVDKLQSRFHFPNIGMKCGAINKLMDKDFQKRLARDSGLKVSSGWTIDIKNGKYVLPEDIQYPCFPKPQISFLGDKRCMRKCSTEAELRSVVDEVARHADCPLLVEQYVEIEKEYGVLGFCAEGKSLTPGLVLKEMIGEGAHKGVTKLGVVTPLANNKSLHDSIGRFLLSTGLTGLCDIDLYESNGVIYFNELNLRFGAFGYSIFCSGVNLPDMLVRTFLGESVDINRVTIRPKTICLSEKVNFEDYLAGYYNHKEYTCINSLADFTFLADKEDPAPYKAFCRHTRILRFKTIVKRIAKRVLLKK